MTTSPPHPMSSFGWSNRLTKNGPYHTTVDDGSRCLFITMAHTSMQCFIYTSHTFSFSIYVGYAKLLSASHATVVPTEVLTLHAIQWLRNAMKPCHSNIPCPGQYLNHSHYEYKFRTLLLCQTKQHQTIILADCFVSCTTATKKTCIHNSFSS